jgi:DNA (cytosine-5)-methyltransferase 1
MSDGCGASASGLLRLSSQGCLWQKTPPCFSEMIKAARSAESSQPLPPSGTNRSGTLSPLPPLVRRTVEEGSLSWPTPTSSDGGGATKREHCKDWEHRGINLPEAVQRAAVGDKRWPGPKGTMVTFGDDGKPLNVCQDCLEPHDWTGPLNPMWVEWLMGFPPGWTDLDVSETQSCRKSQSSSAGKCSLA